MGFFLELTKDEYLEKSLNLKNNRNTLQRKINDLLDLGYLRSSISDFIKEFGEDDIDKFEDSFYGNYVSGAEFAQNFISDTVEPNHIPHFVVIDWQLTWENLSCDFLITRNNNVFHRHF